MSETLREQLARVTKERDQANARIAILLKRIDNLKLDVNQAAGCTVYEVNADAKGE